LSFIDVSGQCIGLVFKGQAVYPAVFMACLTSEDGTGRFSRNVRN